MTKEIPWDNDYETGIPEIDEQHKIAIDTVNELYNSVGKNTDKEEIIRLVEQLDFYTNSHFETEEKFMRKNNFEGLLDHQRAHEYFKNTYEQIRYSYFYMGCQDSPKHKFVNTYALHLCKALMDWLNYHLNTYDKDLADFIKDRSK